MIPKKKASLNKKNEEAHKREIKNLREINILVSNSTDTHVL